MQCFFSRSTTPENTVIPPCPVSQTVWGVGVQTEKWDKTLSGCGSPKALSGSGSPSSDACMSAKGRCRVKCPTV